MDLYGLCLIYIGLYLICVVLRYIEYCEIMDSNKRYQKEFNLERKYKLHKEDKHRIRALIYKFLWKRYERMIKRYLGW